MAKKWYKRLPHSIKKALHAPSSEYYMKWTNFRKHKFVNWSKSKHKMGLTSRQLASHLFGSGYTNDAGSINAFYSQPRSISYLMGGKQ